MELPESLRSFRHRNFALFFFGQFISRIGMWMQRTAVIWVVYSTTHNAFMIGVVSFAEQFPSFLFSVSGGIIADKYNRYKVIMLTQMLSAVQAILLTVFTFTGHYNIWIILLLSAFLGIVNSYDVPVRQSMVNDIIEDKYDLPNGIALNSSLNTLARLVGPALSGFVLAAYGAAFSFLFNAISFIAVIFAIAAMRLPKEDISKANTSAGSNFKAAVYYLKENKALVTVILIAALSSFFVLSYITLIPVYAKDIFKGSATTYSWLNSALGAGAVIGSFTRASLGKETNFRRLLLTNTFLMGISLSLFAYSHNLYFSLFLSVLSGYCSIGQTSIVMMIVQTETDKAFRGRIVSLIVMAVFGMLPLGSLVVGYTTSFTGPSLTLLIQGIAAIMISIIFYKNLNKDCVKIN